MKHNYSKLVYLFVFLVFSMLFFSACKDKNDNIPYVYVNFRISLTDPEFVALQSTGGYAYVTGGARGIIVYRKSFDTFIAYERACPYDPDCGKVYVDKSVMKAIDNDCCKSEFSIGLDGAVLKGPAEYPLKQYQVTFNQTTNEITVTN